VPQPNYVTGCPSLVVHCVRFSVFLVLSIGAKREEVMKSGYDHKTLQESRNSSVGIATDYRLNGRVGFPEKATDHFLLQGGHTGSGAHPASYIIGTGVFFPSV
jgi:hypothetical protein